MNGQGPTAGWHQLPYRAQAWVPEEKLDYYLDDARRHAPNSKVKLVRDILGFTDRAALRSALVAHARRNDAFPLPDLGYGPRYNVVGPMIGPAGYTMRIASGWIIPPGARAPRNVTLFPAARQGR